MRLVRTLDVDVAFLLQFAIDWTWLWVAGRMTGRRAPPWRMAGAAAVGAALGVTSPFVPGLLTWGWPLKLVGSALLVMLAYLGPVRWQDGVRLTLCFLLTGAAMAGGGLLLAPPTGTGAAAAMPAEGGLWRVYEPLSSASPLVLLGMALALGGGTMLVQAAVAWRRLQAGLCQVDIDFGTGHLVVTALVDTGNQLREPVSGLPVMILPITVLKGLLPAPLLTAAASPGDLETLAHLPGPWVEKCRVVPYNTVGNRDGLLLAVGPVMVRIQPRTAGPGAEQMPVYAALSPGPLDPTGTFMALLPGIIGANAASSSAAAGAWAAPAPVLKVNGRGSG